MLRDNTVIADVLEVITEEDFGHAGHRAIFRATCKLFADGEPADLATLANALHATGEIKDVRYDYLGQLWEAAPVAANAEHYATMVRDEAMFRCLKRAGQDITSAAESRADKPEALLEDAEKRIFEIARMGLRGSAVPLTTALNEACELIDRRVTGELSASCVPTGFCDLDRLLGGFQNSELIIIAARPSIGKTALGICLARNAMVDHELQVYFASLEQSRTELAARLLSAQARVDGYRLRRGTLNSEEKERLAVAREILLRATMHVDDSPTQSMLKIAANARRFKMRRGLHLVVVDYLQLVEPEDRRAPRQEQVASISRRLKILAKDLQVPVVAMAQLNRSLEDRADSRPRLSDLRESGAIEADADTVLLLHRERGTEGVIDLICAKQRNGPTGEVRLAFEGKYMLFSNYAAD
jgi:replicative DNA helicase